MALQVIFWVWAIGVLLTAALTLWHTDDHDWDGIHPAAKWFIVFYTIFAWPHFIIWAICKPCRRFMPW